MYATNDLTSCKADKKTKDGTLRTFIFYTQYVFYGAVVTVQFSYEMGKKI